MVPCILALWVQTSRLNLPLYLLTVELLLDIIFLEVCQLYRIWAMSKLDNILHAAKCFFVNSKQAYIFKGGKTILRVRSCFKMPQLPKGRVERKTDNHSF